MYTAKEILRVSYRLFIEKGYEATNIREICKEVGVKMPTLYYHFQSKENLFYTVYDECWLKYLDNYENQKIINENISAESKLFMLFKQDIQFATDNKDDFKFHLRYKLFPPKEIEGEIERKKLLYNERVDSVIIKVMMQGIEEGMLDKDSLDRCLNLYRKFVFDKMIAIVFFEDYNFYDTLEEAWNSFVNCKKYKKLKKQ
ncbi:TetR/AcrR family transcriptional regulator [Clostridium bowmanii]|uniref:TetR/AcrR family transcriptional regulator n=1 Tax=Clostridium bowmanii TaxID=132925 RepID=UPI001C0BDDEB|nr:TetR/AcrR family transcriptional regulator [Clostridium bowmanii]MBU3191887.1 TetR/AcrR family transcriptional regulator [Clostridium bowmanii]MCA1076121.1 TetR/AcrR family transcriptional regulator [Clostridium bowmanii]